MLSTYFRSLCLLVLLCGVEVSANKVQRFSAAHKRSHLKRQGLDFAPVYGKLALLFEDESPSEVAARIQLFPKHPSLILDDVSHHFEDIFCSSSSMIVRFHTEEAMTEASQAWNTGSDMLFFSTHVSCASKGRYEAYKVTHHSSDQSTRRITLSSVRQTLKQAAHRVSLDLGQHVKNDIEPRIVQRTDSSTTQSTATSSNWQTATKATESFNFEKPTASPSGTKVTGDISFSETNKSVLPPDKIITDLFPGALPLKFVELGCKKCAMTGSLSLEAAGFDVNANDFEKAIDFFDNGFFQFTANKVTAHMEFILGLLQGFRQAPFTANLTKIPLTPIEIPGILTLGPVLEITIPVLATLDTPVNVTAGFQMSIPDKSKIVMNVSDIFSSYQTGFDKTSFKALPLETNIHDVAFNLSAALKPKLSISASVGDTDLGLGINGGVGIFLDLPKLTSEIKPVKNVNKTCDGPAAKGSTNTALSIKNSASFDLGVHWELTADIELINIGRVGEQVLVSKIVQLPGDCLFLDKEKRGIESQLMVRSTSGSKSSKRVWETGLSGITGCVSMLLLVAAIFITL